MSLDLVGVRVRAGDPNVQGVVATDQDGDRVQVQWDDGDLTWSRRDLLYVVIEDER